MCIIFIHVALQKYENGLRNGIELDYFDLFYIKNLAAAERYQYEPMLIF